jgi:hypothetical protein
MDPSTSSPSAPGPLEYGSKFPLHQRLRFQRWRNRVIFIAAAIGFAFYIPSIWRSVQVYYWQRQCLAHPIPSGTVIFSSGPPAISLASPNFDRLAKICASEYRFGGNAKPVTVYIGLRRASNGMSRFLAISGTATLKPGREAAINFLVFNRPLGPGSVDTSGHLWWLAGLNDGWGGSSLQPQPEVLIYSAVEDPIDASHLTFMFDVNVEHCVIDCWLQPDGSLRSREQMFLWHITSQGTRSQPLVAEPNPLIQNSRKPV